MLCQLQQRPSAVHIYKGSAATCSLDRSNAENNPLDTLKHQPGADLN